MCHRLKDDGGNIRRGEYKQERDNSGPSRSRWFLDVEATLTLEPKSIAVFVNRDRGVTLKSKISQHTMVEKQWGKQKAPTEREKVFMVEMASEEMKVGIDIMEKALLSHRHKTYVLDYEQLGLASTWIGLYDFLVSNGFAIKVEKMPVFKNGNEKYFGGN